jgi:hypothetical protein
MHVRTRVIQKQLIVPAHGECALVDQQEDQTDCESPEDHRHDSQHHRAPRADIATLGFAISFTTSASVALADCFVFLLAIHALFQKSGALPGKLRSSGLLSEKSRRPVQVGVIVKIEHVHRLIPTSAVDRSFFSSTSSR